MHTSLTDCQLFSAIRKDLLTVALKRTITNDWFLLKDKSMLQGKLVIYTVTKRTWRGQGIKYGVIVLEGSKS